MPNQFNELPDSWNILVGAATRALEEKGFQPKRLPGRGKSNIWEIEENGEQKRVSIRTTKDRWFAFAPLKKGTKWKTLDGVEIVVVATVDDRDDPNNVEVYWFDADEVHKCFVDSYAARIQARQTVTDGFGMWVNLDTDNRGLPASVGSGLATKDSLIATYPLEKLIAANDPITVENPVDGDTAADGKVFGQELHTIADVMDWGRKRIAALSGVRIEAVKLDCRIET